jgi:VIT1/CCC1 family predicted Fe2+/Mn2+ transporter
MTFRRYKDPVFLRNFVFGIEDSLVSTVGLLSGLASEQISHDTILLTGVVYIFVEAFSMAVGSFLSEESVDDALGKTSKLPIFGSVVMFVSFIVAGFIPIVPYLLLEGQSGLYGSIILSISALFFLGLLSNQFSKIKTKHRALRVALLGGFAILVGVLVGHYFNIG